MCLSLEAAAFVFKLATIEIELTSSLWDQLFLRRLRALDEERHLLYQIGDRTVRPDNVFLWTKTLAYSYTNVDFNWEQYFEKPWFGVSPSVFP